MTDDELRAYLKPKHPPWIAIGGLLLGLLGSAAALGKWVFTAPTAEDYKGHDTRIKAVEMDHEILKAKVDGMRNDLGDVKAATKEINTQLLQLRITGRR